MEEQFAARFGRKYGILHANGTATTETITPTPSEVTTPACSGDGSAPTVFILSPQRNAILGGGG